MSNLVHVSQIIDMAAVLHKLTTQTTACECEHYNIIPEWAIII